MKDTALFTFELPKFGVSAIITIEAVPNSIGKCYWSKLVATGAVAIRRDFSWNQTYPTIQEAYTVAKKALVWELEDRLEKISAEIQKLKEAS